MSFRKILLLATCTMGAACATAPTANDARAEQTTRPLTERVRCELGGAHGDDPDRIAEDERLVVAAIEMTYPRLPAYLRALVDELTFEIDHDDVIRANGKESRPTKMFLGWSAEDDPDYRFPDRTLAPAGTIKVNFSEVFVQHVAFCESGLLKDEVALAGCRDSVADVIAHEVLHAYQYRTAPVRDLATTPNACPDGLCNPYAIRDTKKKIEYEREAWVFGTRFHTVAGMVAYSVECHAIKKQHAALFQSGSRYGLMGAGPDELPPTSKLVEHYAKYRNSNDFDEGSKAFYEGQYRFPDIALSLSLLRDDIEKGSIDRDETRRQYQRISAIWFEATADQGALEHLLATYPYMTAVMHRIEVDSSRVRKLLDTMPE
jgi:hypothetical protein